jgi:hypothetical protein
MIDVDHIDPRWEEGRDYQLVCGLDCKLNYLERDFKFNRKKNNRFLPWRIAEDEIGAVPIEQGDLCQFLVEEKWVLMEFLSDEWFAQTKNFSGSYQGGVKTSEVWEGQTEHLQNIALISWSDEKVRMQRATSISEWAQNNPEKVRERNQKVSDKLKNSQIQKDLGLKSSKTLFQCTITGHISNAGALARWQKKRGIDTSNRIRL